MKVLVVDDQLASRKIIDRFLSKRGFNLVFAEDGYQALEVMATSELDLVISDVEMPVLNGFDFTRIKSTSPLSHIKAIPLILLTSKATLFDEAEGRIVGANSYLTKPFTEEALNNAIDNIRRPE